MSLEVSRPKIGLHKKSKVKEEECKSKYVKRTQRDYTMSFKLAVVKEIESCELTIKGAMRKYGIQSHGTVLNWVRKFGNFDRELQVATIGKIQSPEQELLGLRAEIEVLKKQKAFLERELNNREQKAIMFDAIVQVVKEDYNIDLLKKLHPSGAHLSRKRRTRSRKGM